MYPSGAEPRNADAVSARPLARVRDAAPQVSRTFPASAPFDRLPRCPFLKRPRCKEKVL